MMLPVPFLMENKGVTDALPECTRISRTSLSHELTDCSYLWWCIR